MNNFFKTIVTALLMLFVGASLNAQYCVSGCNYNSYVNSIDPNTIEYDNMVGVFHSSMVRESSGEVKVWGQGIAFNGTGQTGNVLVPQVMNSTNYPGLTGSILKFAGGSNQNTQQFAILTTTGLFIWGGTTGTLVSTTIKNTVTFGAVSVATYPDMTLKSDGLPTGVAPTDVKMMFGSNNTLAIVTCTGAAWVLSTSGNKYGDGITENAVNSAKWHRVKTGATTNLDNVVAVRGTVNAMMALTSDGNLYTWGTNTYTGIGAAANRTYATLMVKPAGITPKMIGMTRSNGGVSYYLLASNGNLYSLGKNDSRQLGTFSTTDSNIWVRVQKSATVSETLNNVVWISPQEHEGNNYAAINVLTNDGKLWAWGNSNNGMLGAGTATVDPTYMPGSIAAGPINPDKLNLTDNLIAVETGGHTTLTIKQCSTKFGYVGHKINGSMADGTAVTGTVTEYNFSDTAALSICGALAGPVVKNLKICLGTSANLADAVTSSLPTGATSIQWWTTITRDPGTQVLNTTSVGPGTYFAFYDPLIVICPSQITVSYLLPTDPGYASCGPVCTEPVLGESFTTTGGAAKTFTQPATDYGFTFDVFKLDNSFNMKINGVSIAATEIEFQQESTPAPGINIRFVDGTTYGTGAPSGTEKIWNLTGNKAAPLIRVVISQTGTIKMFGSKVSGGPLFPLELFNGNSFNNVTWNTTGTNTILITQNVVGTTNISGRGYGLSVIPCPCYKPGIKTGTALDTKMGITALQRAGVDNDNWPMVRKGAHLALEAKTKGFVPTRVANPATAISNPVDGMMVYDTTLNCLRIYVEDTVTPANSSWRCVGTQTCPE